MMRLSTLEGMAVFDRQGKRVGRVLEARSAGAAETEPVFDAREIGHVLVGRKGWLDRLGWLQRNRDAIPWEALDLRRDGLHIVLALPPEKGR